MPLNVIGRAILLFLLTFKWQIASLGVTGWSLYYKIRKSKRLKLGIVFEREFSKGFKLTVENLGEGKGKLFFGSEDLGGLYVEMGGDVIELARLAAATTKDFKWDDKLVEVAASLMGAKAKQVQAAIEADDEVEEPGQQ